MKCGKLFRADFNDCRLNLFRTFPNNLFIEKPMIRSKSADEHVAETYENSSVSSFDDPDKIIETSS